MAHTSIASSGLRLCSAYAKRGCARLPKGVCSLPRWLGTKGGDRRRLPKGWLGGRASRSWLCLAVLLLPCSKHTCRGNQSLWVP